MALGLPFHLPDSSDRGERVGRETERRHPMLSTVKFRDEVVWSTAAFVIMALSLVLAGCGDDGARTATGGRIASDDERDLGVRV